MMLVKPMTVQDVIDVNAYFYIDEETKRGVLIDPGAQADDLLEVVQKNGWTIERILITHGHFDHIGAVETVSRALGVPYAIHENGREYLSDPMMNLSGVFGRNVILNEAVYFNDGDTVPGGLQVIHTPGHTRDSVVFYDAENKIAFSGDTIFKASVGRTDFPGGDANLLRASLLHKVFALPDETVLYSGHSEPTTVGAEKSAGAAWFL